MRQSCDKIHCIPTWFWLLPWQAPNNHPQHFIYDITTYCCAIATIFTQKIINNKKYWGSWNSVTIHFTIRKEPTGYENGTFKKLDPIDLSSGGRHIWGNYVSSSSETCDHNTIIKRLGSEMGK